MSDVLSDATTLRVELGCLWCGHSIGGVTVTTTGRPTNREIRAAIARADLATPPTWDAHGAPRCPRCRGTLFIEQAERRYYNA